MSFDSFICFSPCSLTNLMSHSASEFREFMMKLFNMNITNGRTLLFELMRNDWISRTLQINCTIKSQLMPFPDFDNSSLHIGCSRKITATNFTMILMKYICSVLVRINWLYRIQTENNNWMACCCTFYTVVIVQDEYEIGQVPCLKVYCWSKR